MKQALVIGAVLSAHALGMGQSMRLEYVSHSDALARPVGPISRAAAKTYIDRLEAKRKNSAVYVPWSLPSVEQALTASSGELAKLITAKDDALAKEAAYEAGRRKNTSLVPALSARLKQPNVVVIWSLSEIGTPKALSALRPILRHSDPIVSLYAANCLATHGDKAALPVLKKWLTSGTFLKRPVNNYPPVLVYELETAHNLLRLGYGKNSAEVRTLLSGMRVNKRRLLPQLAATRKPFVLAEIRRLLSDKKEYHGVRAWAASALGSIEDRASVQPLIKALSQPETDVRIAAAQALAKIGDPVALPALDRLAKGEDEGARDPRHNGMHDSYRKAVLAAQTAAATIRGTRSG